MRSCASTAPVTEDTGQLEPQEPEQAVASAAWGRGTGCDPGCRICKAAGTGTGPGAGATGPGGLGGGASLNRASTAPTTGYCWQPEPMDVEQAVATAACGKGTGRGPGCNTSAACGSATACGLTGCRGTTAAAAPGTKDGAGDWPGEGVSKDTVPAAAPAERTLDEELPDSVAGKGPRPPMEKSHIVGSLVWQSPLLGELTASGAAADKPHR